MEDREMSYRCVSRTKSSVHHAKKVVKLRSKRKITSENPDPLWTGCGKAVLGAFGFALAAATSPAVAQLPSEDFFPIGVYAQPLNSFDKWKSRFINRLLI
jgi:hypothetical protein